MKHRLLKSTCALVCLISFFLFSGCENLQDEVKWMTCEVVENTDPDNIEVKITDKRKKKESADVNIIYRGGNGKLVLKGLVEGKPAKNTTYKPAFSIDRSTEGGWNEVADIYKLSNSWIDMKCEKENVIITFNDQGITVNPSNKTAKAYIGGFYIDSILVTFEYQP